ncbi:MAG: aminotransferase class V-fold PLP-dependent enzyme [Chloroflexi bacterium]|nr:aminotransferase class V-fold PLP-dependent enzyme [Chloroflexota bacterium]
MVYLDNAATSFPKPDCVIEAVELCIREKGANPGRGSHHLALAASRAIFGAREALASLFGVSDSTSFAFTYNCTEALNLALKGILKPGDHAITTSAEHNSVTRPLNALEALGVSVSKIQCGADGTLVLADVDAAVTPATRLLAVTGASNVIGTLMPVEELAAICKKHGILFLVDGAQLAGHRPMDLAESGVDLFAFPGHKGLLGPQGTGALYIRPGLELDELLQGGTGANSKAIEQPRERPDRYESGTPNTPGIAGLGAAVELLMKVGLEEIEAKENALTRRLLEGLSEIKGLALYGPPPEVKRSPVVSFNVEGLDADQVAFFLDQSFDVASRSGLHCSPDAHITIGTIDKGAVRLSPGFTNEASDIDEALSAVQAIVKEYGA